MFENIWKCQLLCVYLHCEIIGADMCAFDFAV